MAELQKADGTKPTASQKKTKKHGYSIQTVASSPGSSTSKEVLILDSDDEDDKPPLPKKTVKGKAKAPVASITLDSDSSDGEQDDEEEDAPDDYLPSPPPRNGTAADDDDGGDDVGRLEDSDDDDDGAGGKKAVMLSKGDFRSSTKLDALVNSLKAARAKDANLKAVVFSQVR